MAGKNFAMLTLAGDATKLEKALNRGVGATKDMVDEVESAGRRMQDSATKFDAVGESAGTLDQRAMGFRDTITGVQDVMKGLGDDSLSTSEKLLTVGMGVGDLASGVENLAAPIAKNAVAWVQGFGTMAATTVSSVATQVGAWVTLGVQSTIQALKVAAAWLISIGPLILIGVAIAALVFLIIKHWDTIKRVVAAGAEKVKEIVTRAGRFIVDKFKAALGWVRSNWPKLLMILTGPFGLAVGVIIKHRDKIMGALRRVPGMIRSAFSRVAGMITGPFKNGFRGIINTWNRLVGGKGFTVPSWIPGVGGRGFRIPKLHTGGIFNAPAGRREGLALLSDRETIRTPEQERALRRGGGGGRAVLELRGDGSGLADFLIEVMRRAVRTRGGNVEVVLGGQAAR